MNEFLLDRTVVAAEGSSFSGKSTFIGSLAVLNNAEIIPEYYDVAHNPPFKGMPELAKTESELRTSIDYFLQLEANRVSLQKKSNKKMCAVDRTVASLVSFQSVMGNLDQANDFIWNAEQFMERILIAKRYGQIIVPDTVYILTAGSSDEHTRRIGKRGRIVGNPALEMLNEWGVSELIHAQTVLAASVIYPNSDIYEIDVAQNALAPYTKM